VQSSGSGEQTKLQNKPGAVAPNSSKKPVKARKNEEMKLPREFRKSILEDFDKRFFIILLISLVVHIISVEYLMKHLKKRATPEYFTQIQQKFASLLVDREALLLPEPELVQPTEPIMLPEGTPISAGAEGTGVPTRAPVSSMPAIPLAIGSPETRGIPAEDIASGARGGATASASTMAAMESSVNNVGILAIITGGTGSIGDIEMNDVLVYAETSNRQLRQTLLNYDALKVSRGPDGIGGIGQGGYTGQRIIRGQRQEVQNLTVIDLVGEVPRLGEAQVTEISREERFEELATTYDRRPEIPTTPEEKERLRRKPEAVQAVIQRHNLAVTDCYKSRSKLNPGLKGKVVVRFAIDADGRVIGADVLESTFEEIEIEQCILSRILRWNDFGYGDPTAPPEIYRQVYTFGF